MSRTKYIVVADSGIEVPIVFGNILIHSDVARSYRSKAIVSAGFVYFRVKSDGDGVPQISADCYGHSVSLDIYSRPEDSDLINHHLFGRPMPPTIAT